MSRPQEENVKVKTNRMKKSICLQFLQNIIFLTSFEIMNLLIEIMKTYNF